MSEKFCIDCKYHEIAHCLRALRPGCTEMAKWLVTGKGPKPATIEGFYLCEVERGSYSLACGQDGKNWEPIEPLAPKASDREGA